GDVGGAEVAHQPPVLLVEATIGLLEAEEDVLRHQPEEAATLLEEEIRDAVGATVEASVELADDLGQALAPEAVEEVLRRPPHGGRVQIGPHGGVEVVTAYVEHGHHRVLGLAGELGGDAEIAHGER